MEKDKFIVFIIKDDMLESAYERDDIEEFTDIVDDESISYSVESFDTMNEACAYLNGVFRGCDDRYPCGKMSLCSWIESDNDYIDVILCANS